MTTRKFIKHFWPVSLRLWTAKRGASAVEFAMVAPIFLIMSMGVVEMGRAMFIKSALQFAVEETARYAIVTSTATTSDLETYAATSLSNSGTNVSGATFSVTQEIADSRTYMSIVATYSFTVIIPIVSLPDMTLNAKSRVPIG